MKKILLPIIIILCLNTNAQITHAWEKIGVDSATFSGVYGSEKEYAIQSSNELNSSHHWRVFFIGYKWGYSYNIVSFLQDKHWTSKKIDGDNFVKYACETYNNEKGYNAKLNATFYLDTDERITKVVISGTPDDVIDLYIDYWEHFDFSYNKLKEKHSVYFNSVGDRISFSWVGINPIITITKSDIAHFDTN